MIEGVTDKKEQIRIMAYVLGVSEMQAEFIIDVETEEIDGDLIDTSKEAVKGK